MLNDAKLTPNLCKRLWAEAANTATLLENHIVRNHDNTSAFLQFCGKGKKNLLTSILHKFGKICICTDHSTTHKSKFAARGKRCSFLGYTEGHSIGTYRLLNLDTGRLILSRDMSFMKAVYGDWAHIKNPAYLDLRAQQVDTPNEEANDITRSNIINDSDDDDENEAPVQNRKFQNNIVNDSNDDTDDDDKTRSEDDEAIKEKPLQNNTKLKSALRNLVTSYNQDASMQLNEITNLECANLVTDISTIESTKGNAKKVSTNPRHFTKHGIMRIKPQETIGEAQLERSLQI